MDFENKLKKSKTTLQFGSALSGWSFDMVHAQDPLPEPSSRSMLDARITGDSPYQHRKTLPKKG